MTAVAVDLPNIRSRVRGLYLVLDHRWAARWILGDVIRQAAEFGVTVVQYRHKEGAMNEVYREALELRKIALDSGMVFIVNDRCDVGLAVDADGVHLGQSDLPINLARELLGPRCLIGISTHSPKEVEIATAQGADYLGFGPIFPTTTKANHEPVVGIESLKRVRPLTSLPLVAIGGIRHEFVPQVVGAGADAVAVASGVLDSADPRQAIKCYMKPFQGHERPRPE